MVQENVPTDSVESSGQAETESSRTEHETDHESVTQETREEVLSRDDFRCQTCGRRGPQAGGLATLQIHHIERDPAGMDEHSIENLTTLCRACHSWLHQQSTSEEAPVELSDEDMTVLLPQDVEILRYLADDGPARTGDIQSGLTADLTVNAVRQRLWVLMGLDRLVEERDRQIVDKSRETGEWGLAAQIEASERGYIPDDPQLLLQRMEDEQVLGALERGCSREMISEVLDISVRTTWNKEKRAAAFEFPLKAIYRNGGRGTAQSDADGEQADSTAEEPGASGDTGDVEVWHTPDESDADPDVEEILGEDILKHEQVQDMSKQEEIQDRIQHVIATLEGIGEAV